jgi:cysteine desulfuration protein SufE
LSTEPQPSHPFGISISAADIVDSLSFFDAWDDRYKYIIDLGQELPGMDESDRTDERLIRGCQSQVWLKTWGDHQLWFDADSDAFIVKGLLGVVLAAYNGKTAEQIASFDIEGYFEEIDLLRHLSPTRGNGLRSMVQRIKDEAIKRAEADASKTIQ